MAPGVAEGLIFTQADGGLPGAATAAAAGSKRLIDGWGPPQVDTPPMPWCAAPLAIGKNGCLPSTEGAFARSAQVPAPGGTSDVVAPAEEWGSPLALRVAKR